jgi:hypothetical protein
VRLVSEPRLSAVMVAGSLRERAQRCVDALCAQTEVGAMEVVIVDLAPDGASRLHTAPGVSNVYLSRPNLEHWGRARAEGARAAHGEVLAFIEDHCFPARNWAELILDAHRGPWAAVGYAFTNANPETYVSRASFLARYGMFAHPANGGPARLVSGNNVSYKRDVLLSLGPQLDELMSVDFNVQEALRRQGHGLFVEARALAAHENFEKVRLEGSTGHAYCRRMAADRARAESWPRLRKILYGIGAPFGAPAIRLVRLAASLRGRRPLWGQFVAALPAIAVEYLWDASGEALGYLLGEGESARETLRWELEEERAARVA